MGPVRQESVQDHTGTQTMLYPWDLALILEWGGKLDSQSKTASLAGPSYCQAQPSLGSHSCSRVWVWLQGLVGPLGSGQSMATNQTVSWPSCRAESSAKGIHPFYNNVSGLTSFGEVRTLVPYPVSHVCMHPTCSLQINAHTCAPLMPFPQPVPTEGGGGNESPGHDGRLVPRLRHCGTAGPGSVPGTCDLLPLGCPGGVQKCTKCS